MPLRALAPHDTYSPLSPGETPMPHAPAVTLANGNTCIPQHYLQYRHTESTVRELVSDIHFDQHTPIFVASDHAGLYLQVGMIGRENYDRSLARRPCKLVYGRKWRIDDDTPTAEIIQTAFLAVKKAREHEVRELLTLTDGLTGKISAPFSSHQDLQLMAANRDLIETAALPVLENADQIQAVLADVYFVQQRLQVLSVERRGGSSSLLVDLQLEAAPLARQAEGDLAEFSGLAFSILLREATPVELLYEIMDALIRHSDRFVEEHFRYQDFARFSRQYDPRRIASVSIASRPYARDADHAQFAPIFQSLNYAVDASRAPSLGKGRLAVKNRKMIAGFAQLAGHLPRP